MKTNAIWPYMLLSLLPSGSYNFNNIIQEEISDLQGSWETPCEIIASNTRSKKSTELHENSFIYFTDITFLDTDCSIKDGRTE